MQTVFEVSVLPFTLNLRAISSIRKPRIKSGRATALPAPPPPSPLAAPKIARPRFSGIFLFSFNSQVKVTVRSRDSRHSKIREGVAYSTGKRCEISIRTSAVYVTVEFPSSKRNVPTGLFWKWKTTILYHFNSCALKGTFIVSFLIMMEKWLLKGNISYSRLQC